MNIRCTAEISFVGVINVAGAIVAANRPVLYTEWTERHLTVAITEHASEFLFVGFFASPFVRLVRLQMGGIGVTGVPQSSLVE